MSKFGLSFDEAAAIADPHNPATLGDVVVGRSAVGTPGYGSAPPPDSGPAPTSHGSPGLWKPTATLGAPDESGQRTASFGYEAPSGVGHDVGSFQVIGDSKKGLTFASSAERESAQRAGFGGPGLESVNTNEYAKENAMGLRGPAAQQAQIDVTLDPEKRGRQRLNSIP